MRETAGEPYHKEVATCEQLTFYLAKFKAPAAAAAAAGGGGAAPAAPPEGYKVFKKADIEDDGILALSGGAKKGGKKARGRAGERKDDKPVRPRGSERRVGVLGQACSAGCQAVCRTLDVDAGATCAAAGSLAAPYHFMIGRLQLETGGGGVGH